MLRLLKSSGVNGLVLNNVNACGDNAKFLSAPVLRNVSRNLMPAMADFAITPYISACWASPTILGNVTSDPKSPLAQKWWEDKVNEIYDLWPNFGGFLVKADSEGNVGPQTYNRTEAEGANLLAAALKPHGGIVVWRAFIYGNGEIGKEDIAKQAYDTFMPLDGMFDSNVIVQIKNGPMDFQIREPVSPLISGLKHTHVMMEVQAAQEYTGQQIHAVNLVTMWEDYLNFDTKAHGAGSTIAKLLSNTSRIHGMAAVSNLGSFANWTGHVLAGSNTYGFGRLAWDPFQSAATINHEWVKMTFPTKNDSELVTNTIMNILQESRRVYEGYQSPLGLGQIVAGGTVGQGRGACAPPTAGPGPGPEGAECPRSPLEPRLSDGMLSDVAGTDHYWMDPCSNYGTSNYSSYGLGCDRTSISGTGFAAQYEPSIRDMFNNVETCPKELLLWFHNLHWTYPIRTTKNKTTVPLLDYLRDEHREAVEEARKLAESWDHLEGLVDTDRFNGVKARFAQQLNDAAVWRDVLIDYWTKLSQKGPKQEYAEVFV
eukprot:gnl/MRDRNA2_/MRDRNA2_195534_c0_seq1.p1 gnl/MRDRNA2_/MRDRNA2_195534_c0~~gnl/MRDRNA2_/MRDRNA2_195534_c0_seq1.p1  ORF type:complete len:580 (-),score=88.83 gnl/MRDRNA2_/MRDRNA2_195534_c0_seq1:16-1638(-)